MSTGPEIPHPAIQGDEPHLPFLVVCVGASAGGLDALERFFASVPGDSGMAFIVAQHLSPDFRSMMPELLARKTSIPVRSAETGMPIEPDHIYLLPPKQEVRVDLGKLELTERSLRDGLHLPIDTLFHSAGEMQRDLSVGVILSGSGTDGSRGVRTIKASGGLVLVQSPETAKFDGMPRSALKACNADFSGDPASLADRLLQVSQRTLTEDQAVPDREPVAAPSEYEPLFDLLERRSGIDFRQYKVGTLGRRLQRRLVLSGCESIANLAQLAQTNGKLADNLLDDLLIKVTSFMRDREAFEQLQDLVVEPLLRARQGGSVNDPIRVWVPACATGEEAFSVAMLFHEVARRMDAQLRVKVFATDADPGAIRMASRGVFSTSVVYDLDPGLVDRYFDRDGDRHILRRSLRDSVTFAIHNVLVDPPFTRLDLVCCRNMLIYLRPEVQARVIDRLAFSLVEGGALFLGASETLASSQQELFDCLSQRWKIYRLRSRPKPPLLPPVSHRSSNGARSSSGEEPARPRPNATEAMGDHILRTVGPPGFVVGSNYELHYIFGDVSPYMKLAHGAPRTSVLPMLRAPLSVLVTSAVRKAADENKAQRVAGVQVQDLKESELFDIVVTPMPSVSRDSDHFVVHFEDMPRSMAGSDETLAPGHASQLRIEELEGELALTRDHLQSAVHELEAYNEELQTTNEELLASNEELQATNEELQSVNEELYTVNTEHQRKLDELERTTGDLTGVLAATQAGVLLLDGELNVRRFNRAVTRIFPLTRMDEGRPIADFKMRVNYPDLLRDLRSVLETGRPVHREVQAVETWWRFDLRPTEPAAQESGVVFTAQDQTNLSIKKMAWQQLNGGTQAAVKSADLGLLIIDPEADTVVFGGAAARLLGIAEDDVFGLQDGLRLMGIESKEMAELAEEGDDHRSIEGVHVLQGAEGRRFSVKLRIEPWRAPDTSRRCFTGVFVPLDSTFLEPPAR
ncbi:MAG: chemotaxis protein CheB [Myxococcota bacterium]